jgi:hypothetical protein
VRSAGRGQRESKWDAPASAGDVFHDAAGRSSAILPCQLPATRLSPPISPPAIQRKYRTGIDALCSLLRGHRQSLSIYLAALTFPCYWLSGKRGRAQLSETRYVQAVLDDLIAVPARAAWACLEGAGQVSAVIFCACRRSLVLAPSFRHRRTSRDW